jgi:hypothetical protein
MTVALIAVPSLIVVLALMFALTQTKHRPPQSYLHRKERGPTIAWGEYRADPDWDALRKRGRR